ncbi:MAG TPA: DUF1343 domain-containing protein [Bacteroidota bacterium]|nr:DUF1343 domain-containing protein [Bacteroidota bacterium]
MRSLTALCTVLLSSACLFAQPVRTGLEVLREENFAPLRGKRIGLITNPTGVDRNLQSTVDILRSAPGVTLVAIFGPEHGAWGSRAPGAPVESDTSRGLPMFSLYGKTRKPTPEMLKGIDLLVYDIQDIGCRSYTFISTMGLAMEAARDAGIGFVVLDRPNPLGGERVEGNIVEKGFESFVGAYPIPYLYGLTCGELARFINGEGLLQGGGRCSLQVIAMKGWRRSMKFQETGLPWVPPSPHIPEMETATHYPSTGMLGELGVVSEGVGYTLPFKVLAAEWIDPEAIAGKMSALKIDGVRFRPIRFAPFYGKEKDQDLGGVQVYISDSTKASLMSIQFRFLEAQSELYPGKNPFAIADSSRVKMFDKVAGTDKVRLLFTKRMKYEDLRPFLERDAAPFRAKAARYLLY